MVKPRVTAGFKLHEASDMGDTGENVPMRWSPQLLGVLAALVILIYTWVLPPQPSHKTGGSYRDISLNMTPILKQRYNRWRHPGGQNLHTLRATYHGCGALGGPPGMNVRPTAAWINTMSHVDEGWRPRHTWFVFIGG